MSQIPSYAGGCHCGAVRFTARTDIEQLFDCNCSRCRRVAAVMTAVPAADFELLQGEEDLQPYRFNHHAIEHLFCRHCGIQAFSRGSGANGPTVVLNVGCLEGVPVVDRSAITHYDGAAS